MASIDLTKGTEKGEFVAIPALDMYDHPHPKIMINRDEYLPGNTYKLPTERAAEVKRILARLEQSAIRLLRPRKDRRTLQQLEANNPTTGVIMDRD